MKLFLRGLLALCLSAVILVQAQAGPVSGASLWLAADQGVTTNSSGIVTSWADLSGNGHNASSSAGPTFVSNGLNGHATLQFNGGQDLGISGQIITSQQYTIMAIVTDASTGTGFREIISNWSAGNQGTSVFLGDTGRNPTRVRFTDNFGGADQGQQGVGTVSNPTSPFILTGVSGVSDATVYQNSTLIADKGSALTPRNLTTPWVIGDQGGLVSEFWQGDISEILVYNRALTTQELQENWTYLDNKYFGTATPEPASLTLLGLGAVGVAGYSWRRRRQN